MSDHGQRMSGNNDLMDPDWKPTPAPTPDYIFLQKLIYDHFEHYAELLDKHKDINWETHHLSVHVNKYNLERLKKIISGLGLKK